MQAQIPVFDGFDEIDAFGPFEVLNSAGITTTLVGLERPGLVVSMRGVRIEVEDVLGRPDLVVVPGGGWLNHAPAGSWAEAQRGVLPRLLAEQAAAGVLLASVCTGSLVLGAAGLLQGQPATTNRNAVGELAGFGATVVDARVVDAGPVVTAGGLTAGIDLGLWLAERLLGRDVADRVAASIEYQRQGQVWKSGNDHPDRRGGQ